MSLFVAVLISLLAGGIGVFAYAPFAFWPAAFFSYIILLWLIAGRSKKQAALLGFFWAVGYFSAGIHWVYISIRQYGELPAPLVVIILALLVTYLSLYPLLFALLTRQLNRYAPPYSLVQLAILTPVLWQCTEFLRGTVLGGFGWLQFGYSQLGGPLQGMFPLLGSDGVTLLFTSLVGLSLYLIKQLIAKNYRTVLASGATLVISVSISLGLNTWPWVTPDLSRPANITLLQGNIPQSLRWNEQQLETTLTTYTRLTQPYLQPNQIVIWPEAAITDFETRQQPFLQALDERARQSASSVAIGLIDLRPATDHYQVFNTLIVLGDQQAYHYPTTNRYEKHHLVPFGEYTPLQSVLAPLAELLSIPMSSMTPGPVKQAPLVMQGFKFTTAICYEIILPSLVLANFTPDTDFLLTVSNDAWFGNSIGPKQHLQMARARALEFGRPLLRSTNNGITAVIDERGQIMQQLPQFEEASLAVTLAPTTGLTPFAYWGHTPYYLLMVLSLVITFVRRTGRRQ